MISTPKNPKKNSIINTSVPILSIPEEQKVVDKKSKFRICNKKIFVTIKNHYNQDFIDFINKIKPIKKWILCNEKGKEGEYDHTHCAIEFISPLETTNCRIFDYQNEHPNIQVCRNWEASIVYCLKEGINILTNIDDKILKKLKLGSTKFMEETINNIVNSKNMIEAFTKNADSLKDICAIEKIYNHKNFTIPKKLVEKYSNSEYKPWQIQLINIINKPPNDRDVNWIIDEIGGNGKSFFCRKFMFEHVDTCLTISTSGKASDIADVIRNWMQNDNIPLYIFIDLPRTFEDRNSIYTILEDIKNGCITCTKYKGHVLYFESPHIVVYSNWKPQISKLSKDRWKIFYIENEILNPITNIKNTLGPVTLGSQLHDKHEYSDDSPNNNELMFVMDDYD